MSRTISDKSMDKSISAAINAGDLAWLKDMVTNDRFVMLGEKQLEQAAYRRVNNTPHADEVFNFVTEIMLARSTPAEITQAVHHVAGVLERSIERGGRHTSTPTEKRVIAVAGSLNAFLDQVEAKASASARVSVSASTSSLPAARPSA